MLKKNSFELRFLDSYAFMAFPLAKLVSNLKEFSIMLKIVEIFKRKGVFPYEWFDSFDKLYQTEFPPYEV